MPNYRPMRIRITSKITPLDYLKCRVLFSQLQNRGTYFRQQQSSVKAIFANDLIGHEISVYGTYEKLLTFKRVADLHEHRDPIFVEVPRFENS